MPDAFDPYFKWLGIPKADQPPHAYRLLGIELFESDANVISNAADGRMAQIKSFQTGRFAAVSQKLLNEIAAAKVCLLNPQKKVEYDQRLQAHLQQKVAANPNLGKPEIAADHDHEYKVPDMVPAVGAEEGVASLPFIDFSTTPTRSTTRLAKRGKQPAWIIPAGVGAAAIALVAGVAVYFSFAGDNKDKSANPQTADHGYVVPVAGDPRRVRRRRPSCLPGLRKIWPSARARRFRSGLSRIPPARRRTCTILLRNPPLLQRRLGLRNRKSGPSRRSNW